MSWSLVYFLLAQNRNNFTQMPMYINSLKDKNEMLHAEIFPPFMKSDMFLLQLNFQVITVIECYGSSFPIPVENSERLWNTESNGRELRIEGNSWRTQNLSPLIKEQRWVAIWILEVSNTQGQEGARPSKLTGGGSWSRFSQYDIYWSIDFLLFPIYP